MNEIYAIENLIKLASNYRRSRVIEKERVGDVVVCLVDRLGEKKRISCSSIDQIGEDCCPYCSEAIPLKTIIEIDDWLITGNKFASTDFEVSIVSKKHESHINTSDFRVWMNAVNQTGACLIYSPLRKSLPFHKHAQLIYMPNLLLDNIPRKWIDNKVGIIDDGIRKALAICGDFEFKLKKTVHILNKLYSREHAYNLAITPTDVYIMPSNKSRKVLGNRVFIGLISTEDKGFFEYVKKEPSKRDDSYKIPDYTKCNYSDGELIDLTMTYNEAIAINQARLVGRLESFVADVGEVLFFEKEMSHIAHEISELFKIKCRIHNHVFVTDKKGEFHSNEISISQDNVIQKDVLVVVNWFGKGLFDSLLRFMAKNFINRVFVLKKSNSYNFELKIVLLDSGWDEFNAFPGMLI